MRPRRATSYETSTATISGAHAWWRRTHLRLRPPTDANDARLELEDALKELIERVVRVAQDQDGWRTLRDLLRWRGGGRQEHGRAAIRRDADRTLTGYGLSLIHI